MGYIPLLFVHQESHGFFKHQVKNSAPPGKEMSLNNVGTYFILSFKSAVEYWNYQFISTKDDTCPHDRFLNVLLH